jgi:hypothetical protein
MSKFAFSTASLAIISIEKLSTATTSRQASIWIRPLFRAKIFHLGIISGRTNSKKYRVVL